MRSGATVLDVRCGHTIASQSYRTTVMSELIRRERTKRLDEERNLMVSDVAGSVASGMRDELET